MKDVNSALSQSQEEWKEKIKETQKKLEDDSKDQKIQELQVCSNKLVSAFRSKFEI